jgi:MFS transporter, DHA2 family, multidrug resistance protein
MASATTAPQDQSADVTKGVNPWLIAASVMLATFMEVLDTAIASVALPYIAGSLSASNDEATWVLTSYLVANAIVLPASNWFSLKFGRKRFLLSCIVIFTISSFACGAAPSLGILLLARIVQGAGGGALQPLSQAILLESFPPAKRGAAMAVFAFGVVVAPVLGPTLGGWLTDTYSWRYAFYINIPIGVLAILMISRFVHDPPFISKARVPAFDRYGFAALVVWTGCLQVVLDKGQEDDWFGATWIRWAVFFLVTSFIYFCWHCWRDKDAIVDLKVLKDRNFRLGCILIFMFGVGIYSTTTVLPLFFQELLGYTAFTAGIAVAPRGIGAVCGMPVIGYLSSKVDPRYLLTFGFLTFGLTTLYFGNVTLQISPTTLLLPILITGFGLSFIFVPISTAAYGTLDTKQIGNASGLFNLMRNVGGSIGISIASTLLTRRADVHQNEIPTRSPEPVSSFRTPSAA